MSRTKPHEPQVAALSSRARMLDAVLGASARGEGLAWLKPAADGGDLVITERLLEEPDLPACVPRSLRGIAALAGGALGVHAVRDAGGVRRVRGVRIPRARLLG